jgi:hypothetical protein
MLTNVFVQFIFLILAKFGNDKIIEFIEEEYEYGTLIMFIIYTLLNFIPLVILTFIQVNETCKDKPVSFKINKAINETFIKLGGTEIFKNVIGLIPILGKVLSLLEFIPYVEKFLSVLYYFIIAGIVNLFSKLNKNYCSGVSGLERFSAVFLGGIYISINLLSELIAGILPF